METTEIGTSGITASRIALSTWAIGGWAWGGNTVDLERSIDTIRSAIDRGITLIDTAPVYGFGLSERIVGTVLSGGLRDRAIIATKGGLQWRDGKVRRNSSPAHIRNEVEESLRRLRTDHIDLYQVHWPDPLVPIQETAKTLARLLQDGKIRAIGLSKYSPAQMDEFRQATGTISSTTHFKGDDLRRSDPKFQEPRFSQYLSAVASLNRYARECYGQKVIALAVRWVLDQGNTIAPWGARYPEQLDSVKSVMGWKLDEMAQRYIEKVIRHTVKDPVGPELMAAPLPSKAALVA